MTLDLEHLRGRCRHLQEELEGVRRTLSTEREEGHLRVLKLESSLNAAKKTNMELEVYIAAYSYSEVPYTSQLSIIFYFILLFFRGALKL